MEIIVGDIFSTTSSNVNIDCTYLWETNEEKTLPSRSPTPHHRVSSSSLFPQVASVLLFVSRVENKNNKLWIWTSDQPYSGSLLWMKSELYCFVDAIKFVRPTVACVFGIPKLWNDLERSSMSVMVANREPVCSNVVYRELCISI